MGHVTEACEAAIIHISMDEEPLLRASHGVKLTEENAIVALKWLLKSKFVCVARGLI